MFPGCYGDDKQIETCLACGEPTGKAGKGEDSIYVGDVSPFCEQCWLDVLLWVETDRDVKLASLTARLAAAEEERDENYRLWKEACRVKDIRHKAAKERRNSICLDCKCMRECLKVSDKWVCPECLTARLAAAEEENAIWNKVACPCCRNDYDEAVRERP